MGAILNLGYGNVDMEPGDVVLVTGNFENATLEWKLGRVTLDCNIYKSRALNSVNPVGKYLEN